jgi:hypothetical protein
VGSKHFENRACREWWSIHVEAWQRSGLSQRENGNRSQPRDTLEQGHHLAIPDRGQRILSPPTARRFLLRRQSGVLLNAIGGGDAEPGLGRGDDRRLGLAQTHE